MMFFISPLRFLQKHFIQESQSIFPILDLHFFTPTITLVDYYIDMYTTVTLVNVTFHVPVSFFKSVVS